MMGCEGDLGIIPRLCNGIFEMFDDVSWQCLFSRRFCSIQQNTNSDIAYKVEASFMEIYNEKVRDLLSVSRKHESLRVREHTVLGPYVEGSVASASFDSMRLIPVQAEQARCDRLPRNRDAS